MSAFGLTSTGFNPKRLSDLDTELKASFRDSFGDIDTESDSVWGQIIGLMAYYLADVWAQTHAVYLSKYPSSASGLSLRRVGEMNNVPPLEPLATRVVAQFMGTEGTLVVAGTGVDAFIVKDLGNSYQLLENFEITKDIVQKAVCTILSAVAGTTYSIIVNGNTYSYVAGISDTETEIANEIVPLINAGETELVASNVGGVITLFINLDTQDFSVDVNANVELTEFWSPGTFSNLITGTIPVYVGYIDTIDTTLAGVDEVTNLFQGTVGRGEESDAAYRIRRVQSILQKSAVLEAIQTRILTDVENVLACYAYENDTAIEDIYGRPPHSIHVVVDGGLDIEIAEELLSVKPGGITTFGEVSNIVTDNYGHEHTINFSRPVSKYVHLRLKYTIDSESTFPVDGETQIANLVYASSLSYTIGKNVILQKFLAEPFIQVPGIASLTIEGAITTNPGDTPTYQSTNIDIAPNEVCVFDLTRIIVEAL
jgi:hypothetical protein